MSPSRPTSPRPATISSTPTRCSSTSADTLSGSALPTPCTRLADRHWIQTPYRYFPVEPHWLFPGFQFLPLALRAEVARRWPLAHVRSSSREDGLRGAMSVELLSRSEMAFYFPDSTVRFERLMSLIKSLIAVKS